jgi:hypothetical protein
MPTKIGSLTVFDLLTSTDKAKGVVGSIFALNLPIFSYKILLSSYAANSNLAVITASAINGYFTQIALVTVSSIAYIGLSELLRFSTFSITLKETISINTNAYLAVSSVSIFDISSVITVGIGMIGVIQEISITFPFIYIINQAFGNDFYQNSNIMQFAKNDLKSVGLIPKNINTPQSLLLAIILKLVSAQVEGFFDKREFWDTRIIEENNQKYQYSAFIFEYKEPI